MINTFRTKDSLTVAIFSCLITAAVFVFLTAGIPLIQLGVISDFGESKKYYVKAASSALLIIGILLGFFRWKFPLLFQRLWLIRWGQSLSNRPFQANLWILWFVYAVLLTAAGLFHHEALETRAFDLGIFAQALWNTTQGHFLFSSLKGDICLLGDHFSPLLVLLVPFYKLWPDPRVLLVIQPLISAGCLFPLAKIAASRFEDRRVVWVFCLIYFFYMPTRAALHEDFHPEVLVEPLMFWAFLWLEQKRKFLFALSLVLILCAKENMAGIVFMFGFYAFFFKHEKLPGMFWMLFAPFYLTFCTQWMIPFLSHQPYLYGGFYDSLFQNGTSLWTLLADGERWGYLFKAFAPVLFLSWLDLPSLTLTLPVLAQNLLSDNSVVRSFNYHYTTGLTPFVFISAILGLKRVHSDRRIPPKVFSILVLGLLMMGLLRSGAPEYFYVWQSASRVNERTRMIRMQMSRIASDASVLTHNNLAPQAAQRRELYQFDHNGTPTKTELALKYHADYIVMDERHWEPGTRPMALEKEEMLHSGYVQDYEEDGFLILKNKDV